MPTLQQALSALRIQLKPVSPAVSPAPKARPSGPRRVEFGTFNAGQRERQPRPIYGSTERRQLGGLPPAPPKSQFNC